MRNKWNLVLALGLCSSLFPSATRASEQVGTFTQVDGEVKLFSHPAPALQGEQGTHALYEGEYYLVESAAVGAKVEQGNIVRTAPGAKARVVFDNGDQINVGSGTAMRIFWNKDARNANTHMDLAYGKLRGVIEKGGPRSHLQIRTKTATMGVRGTDFFIADDGTDGGTEVSIMRGSVEVTPKVAEGKPVEVKQGYSASVPPTLHAKTEESVAAKQMPPIVEAKVEIRKTTQEEFSGIQKSSTIAKKPDAPAATPEVAKLEVKAVETAMKDIKRYDPVMYAQLETSKPTSTDDVNQHVVQSLSKEAPRAPEHHKPFKAEIDDLDQGAYEKYFKIE